MSQFVSYSSSEYVATLTMNDPDRLNCFSAELVDELHTVLDQVHADGSNHVVFKASGKGFSGGLDLSGIENEKASNHLFVLNVVSDFASLTKLILVLHS